MTYDRDRGKISRLSLGVCLNLSILPRKGRGGDRHPFSELSGLGNLLGSIIDNDRLVLVSGVGV